MESKEVDVMFDPNEEEEDEEETSLRKRLIKPSEEDLRDVLEDELRESKYGKKVPRSWLVDRFGFSSDRLMVW